MGTTQEQQTEPQAEQSKVELRASKVTPSGRLKTLKNWIVWGFVIAMVFAMPSIYQLAKYVISTTAA